MPGGGGGRRRRRRKGSAGSGFSHQVAKGGFSSPYSPSLWMSSPPAKPAHGQACLHLPARAQLLRGWELLAPRAPRKELRPLPGPRFASRWLWEPDDKRGLLEEHPRGCGYLAQGL